MGEASSWKTWLARVLMCRRRTWGSCLGRHGPARKKDHGQRRRFVAKDALSFNTMLTRVNLSRGRTTSSRLGRLGPAPKKAHGQRRRFVTKEASSWKTWLTRVLMCRRRTTLSCQMAPKRSYWAATVLHTFFLSIHFHAASDRLVKSP